MNKINEIIKKGNNERNKKEFKLINLIKDLIDIYTSIQSGSSIDYDDMIDNFNNFIEDAKDFYISYRIQNAIEEAIRKEFYKIEREITQKLRDLTNYAKKEFNLNLKEIFELIEKYNDDYEYIDFRDFVHVANDYDKNDPILNGFNKNDYYDDDDDDDDYYDDDDDDDDY